MFKTENSENFRLWRAPYRESPQRPAARGLKWTKNFENLKNYGQFSKNTILNPPFPNFCNSSPLPLQYQYQQQGDRSAIRTSVRNYSKTSSGTMHTTSSVDLDLFDKVVVFVLSRFTGVTTRRLDVDLVILMNFAKQCHVHIRHPTPRSSGTYFFDNFHRLYILD